MRPLGIALRRCWGPWLVLPVLVLEYIHVSDKVVAYGMLAVPAAALGEANEVLIPLNPLLAAVVCAESLALFGTARGSLVWALPDSGWRAVVTPVGATTVWVMATHVVVVAGVVTASVIADPATVPSLWPMGPALASMVAYAAIGVAAARLLPWKVTPPLLPVVLYLGGIFISDRAPLLVDVGGGVKSMAVFEYRLDVLAGQVGWMLAVAAAGLLIAVVSWRSGYAGLLRRGAAAVAVLVVAGVALTSMDRARQVRDLTLELDCRGHDPQVCVVPAYAEHLPEVHSTIAKIVDRLDALGVVTPARFQQGWGRTSARDVGQISMEDGTVDLHTRTVGVIFSLVCPTNERIYPEVNRIATWVTKSIRTPGYGDTRAGRRHRAEAEKLVEHLIQCR